MAHREEILSQAAQTFLRIRPESRVGLYVGQSHDAEVDVLCASVQTLARAAHLERFAAQHFDYVVIDEFHHAAAATYRRLLGHFAPAFLLGLTATPDRTDQSDILSLCDDNLVFTCNLFEGVQAKLLARHSTTTAFSTNRSTTARYRGAMVGSILSNSRTSWRRWHVRGTPSGSGVYERRSALSRSVSRSTMPSTWLRSFKRSALPRLRSTQDRLSAVREPWNSCARAG